MAENYTDGICSTDALVNQVNRSVSQPCHRRGVGSYQKGQKLLTHVLPPPRPMRVWRQQKFWAFLFPSSCTLFFPRGALQLSSGRLR